MSASVGDYLQFECDGQTRRFGWTGPWPPPVRMALLLGGSSGFATVAEDTPDLWATLRRSAGASEVTSWRCIRESHSTLPPQTADSHVARGALYRPSGVFGPGTFPPPAPSVADDACLTCREKPDHGAVHASATPASLPGRTTASLLCCVGLPCPRCLAVLNDAATQGGGE